MSDEPNIDEDAAAANSTQNFETPSDATIGAVLVRLGEPQLRRSFFSRLENPNWVRALAERDALPAPQVTEGDEGGRFHAPWPEGDYLVRVAELVPDEVLGVLESLTETENWFAQAAIIKATAELPPRLAVRLAAPVSTYVEVGSSHDPVDLAAAALNVSQSGDWQATLSVVRAIYEPRQTGTEEGPDGTRPQVGAGIENYWFSETLPRVASALTEQHRQSGVRTLVAWLEQWQELTGEYSDETGRDISSSWRPSIAPHPQNSGFEDMGDTLVDAVRDSIVRLCELEGPAAGIRPVQNSPQPLLQRIGMEAIAIVAGDPSNHVDPSETMNLARRWIDDEEYLEHTYRVEYSHLLGAIAKRMSKAVVDRWIAMIKAHEFLPSGLIAELLADRDRASTDVSDDEVDRYRDLCRRDLLAAIRSEDLPDEVVGYRDELVRTHGEAREHVEFSSWSESFVGPTSPLSSDELDRLSIADLVAYLSRWTPPDERIFGPSAEGIGRQIADRVERDPQAFASEARRFVGLDATYVRSLLQGLDRALRDEPRPIDWNSVVSLCEYVVAQPGGSDDDRHDLERDQIWIWARDAVASLLATAASTEALATEYGRRTLDILTVLTSDSQPTPAYEERYGGDNMDPLTLSLNTVRPVAVRAVVRLFLANNARPEPVPAVHEGMLNLLDEHLGTDSDPSLAVQAVFGEHLGRLVCEAAADWLGDRVVRVLGDPATELARLQTSGPDTVWSTMLATYRPSAWIVETLGDFMAQRIDAVGSGRAEVIGWRRQRTPNQLLGDWLVTLFIRGDIDGPADEEGLLTRFFQKAAPQLSAEVLERLGWALGRSTDVPPEVLSRAQELWDWRSLTVQSDRSRADELNGFAAWVRSGQFPASWWVPELLLAVNTTELGLRIGLGEALSDAARSGHGCEALEIAQNLMSDRDGFGAHELTRHLPVILAVALQDEDQDVRSTASSLLDTLGREGHLSLAEEVAKARSSL